MKFAKHKYILKNYDFIEFYSRFSSSIVSKIRILLQNLILVD